MKNELQRIQIGLRLPPELNRRLENYVSKIGISKQAFILNLIFRELEDKDGTAKNDWRQNL